MVGPPSDGFQLGAFFVSGFFSAGHVAASGSRSAGARTRLEPVADGGACQGDSLSPRNRGGIRTSRPG